MLYPDAKILVQPFEDTRLPNNSFDLIIGNPPFADIKIADPEYSDPKLSLHNYFLVKSLDKLKPGGIAVCISSHYTLDSLDVRAAARDGRQGGPDRGNSAARRYLSEKRQHIGHHRHSVLPQTATEPELPCHVHCRVDAFSFN